MLVEYFPIDLAKVIKKTVTIKPKVVSHSLYMVTLDADGIATIIDTKDKQITIIRKVRHIHDIFGGEGEIVDRTFQQVHFITNEGELATIDSPQKSKFYWEMGQTFVDSDDDDDNTIHIATGGSIEIYVNVRGEVEILNGDGLTDINFPEPVVSTAVTSDSILFLTVSGVVRVYHSDSTPSFEEFSEEFWEYETDKPKMEDIVMDNLDKETIFYDVTKIVVSDASAIMLKINNQVHHIIGYRSVEAVDSSGRVSDISSSTEGPILELLLDGRVESDEKLIPHVRDIVAISSGENSSLINANGQVLINFYESDSSIFTTIPRLRLAV